MKKWMYNTLIIIFALIFLGSAAALGFYYWESSQEQDRYEALSQLRPTSPLPTTPEQPDQPAVTGPEMVTVTDPKTGAQLEIFKEFEALYGMNSDLIGWLTIPGVAVDLPVVHTPDDPEYYLRRNFDKKRQTRGCLFLDGAADPWKPSDNLTVYGHRMQDGTMFGQLLNYLDFEYLLDNQDVYIAFPEKTAHYTAVACLIVDGADNPIYDDIGQRGDIQHIIDYIYANTEVDPDAELSGDSSLLILSTCHRAYYSARTLLICIPD